MPNWIKVDRLINNYGLIFILHYRSSSQNNNYKCKDTKLKNVKQITKSKTSQKDDNLKKRSYQSSKIPVLPNLEAKLSFLSSLSCK